VRRTVQRQRVRPMRSRASAKVGRPRGPRTASEF
jgi:hypothetical protein